MEVESGERHDSHFLEGHFESFLSMCVSGRTHWYLIVSLDDLLVVGKQVSVEAPRCLLILVQSAQEHLPRCC